MGKSLSFFLFLSLSLCFSLLSLASKFDPLDLSVIPPHSQNVKEGCERELTIPRMKGSKQEKKEKLKIWTYCDKDGEPTEIISSFIESHGAWERKKMMQLSILKPFISQEDRVAYDIGGHIGQFSIFLAGDLGLRVFAFEPFAPSIALFKKSIASNHLEDKITLFETALSDNNKKDLAVFCPLNLGVVKILSEEEIKNEDNWPTCCEFGGHKEPCRVVELQKNKLDNVLLDYVLDHKFDENCPTEFSLRVPASFMKIDVEGHELAVLKGAEGLLSDEYARPRIIFTEFNISPETLDKYVELCEFLRNKGYHLFLNQNFQDQPWYYIKPSDIRNGLLYILNLGEMPSGGLDLYAFITEVVKLPEFRRVGTGVFELFD